MPTLLLATRNPGKVREIVDILRDLGLDTRSLLDFPNLPEVAEDGSTFGENALKKARQGFDRTGIPTLGDDSGLEVSFLNGKPGIYSARYSGKNATYESNNKKLLRALKNASGDQRRAQFRCVVAFVNAGVEKVVEGICPGTIANAPRGKGGFGYDPIFLPDGFQKTYAELPPNVKNRISHRGIALQAIKNFLAEYFHPPP